MFDTIIGIGEILFGILFINYDKNFVSFEIALPPLYNKDRYINRKYLTDKCKHKYGVNIE